MFRPQHFNCQRRGLQFLSDYILILRAQVNYFYPILLKTKQSGAKKNLNEDGDNFLIVVLSSPNKAGEGEAEQRVI